MDRYSGEKRVLYFDMLNIAATFCVVWLHFNNEIHWYSPTFEWKQTVLVQAVAYWAVPVFFMLSGAILFEYRNRYNTATFFKHRIQKVFIPFLIWGTVFLIWRLSRGEVAPLPSGLVEKQWTVLDIFVNNKMEPIYWFFAPLFSIYMSIPAMSCFTTEKNRPIVNYLISIGIVMITLLPFCYNFINTLLNIGTGWWNGSWNPAILGGYLLYPLTGYWASKREFSKKERIFLYFGGVLMCVFRLCGIYYLCTRDGAKNSVFFDYLCFPSYLLALAVFVFFKYISWEKIFKKKVLHSCIRRISQCSFGVYLIHLLVLTQMQENEFLAWGGQRLIWHFVAPFLCYSICVGIVFTIKKIPFLRFIFP